MHRRFRFRVCMKEGKVRRNRKGRSLCRMGFKGVFFLIFFFWGGRQGSFMHFFATTVQLNFTFGRYHKRNHINVAPADILHRCISFSLFRSAIRKASAVESLYSISCKLIYFWITLPLVLHCTEKSLLRDVKLLGRYLNKIWFG